MPHRATLLPMKIHSHLPLSRTQALERWRPLHWPFLQFDHSRTQLELRQDSPREMNPVAEATFVASTESMDMRTVEARATPQPSHMFLVGRSPANVASRGVKMLVACKRLLTLCLFPQVCFLNDANSILKQPYNQSCASCLIIIK